MYQFDRQKLKTIILRACRATDDPGQLGKVKLHKILYFSDMLFFAKNGRPLTGAVYVKQAYGPMARELGRVIDEMKSE